MEIVDVQQGTPEWLSWRKSGVTATCAPILMGAENATKTPYELYLHYVGLLEPEDLSAIKQVRAGKLNEPLARAWAERKYGQISLPLCVRHREYHHLIASLDGIFDDGHILEIKNLASTKHLEILQNGTHSPEFKYYFWQAQHQLLVTGAPGVYLLFWSAKDEPKVFLIKPSQKSHERLLKAATEFYENVMNKKAPPFDTEKDVLLISDAEILKQTPGFSAPSDLDARVSAIRRHALELEKAKAEVERLDALTKAGISGLADALGFQPESPIRLDGFGIRYLESVVKGTVNWKSLAKKLIPNVIPENHPDCINNEKKLSKLTTYEYSPTSGDTIVVANPDALNAKPLPALSPSSDYSEGQSHLDVTDINEEGILLF
ncbi:lambda-exonuclease family protein [Cronobacter turicensis]